MTKVRQAAFETNSSSSHSITISTKDEIRDTLPLFDSPNTGKYCSIFPGEFGWGIDTYNDAATKASYCLTWLRECGDYGITEDQIDEYQTMLVKVVMKRTGADYVVLESNSDDFYPDGYIDHQSMDYGGGVGKEAFESEDTLERFIFCKRSTLLIDNDNH